jgi:hypothetical protein
LTNKKIKIIMIKSKHFSFVILAGAALLVSSCTNQMYSYRKKVNVEQQTAKVQTPETPIEIEALKSKTSELPVSKMTAPAIAYLSATAVAPVGVSPKMEPVIKDIQTMVPQHSSKAAIAFAKKEFKSAKEQIKILKKDIQKANSALVIDGKRWMLVGAIVWLIGTILAIITLGSIGWLIASVGGVIFLVGLIFFLLDILV